MSFPRVAMLLALCFLAGSAGAQAITDGPYVVRGAAGGLEAWRVEDVNGAGVRNVQPVAANATIRIAAVGALPAFDVPLHPAASPAPDAITLPAKAKLFVVADTHGEFEILAGMLLKHGVLDAKLGWSFGRGHLVVLGDVFDRGPNHTEILWLLYALEAQARKAGGGVHLVLGNHETMVLRGDLRYLNEKYLVTNAVLGTRTYAQLFDARSVLGQWLRSRPAVLKLGRRIYLHGGLSRALVDQGFSLADINAAVRAALADTPPADAARVEMIMGPLGPLWYRGYFPEQADFPTATEADIDAVLKHFGVDTILVGHTIVPTITPLYGGRVIAVQVYPKREDATHVHFEALRIDGAKMQRAKADGTVEPLTPP